MLAAQATAGNDAAARIAQGFGLLFAGAFLVAWVGMLAVVRIQRVRGRRAARWIVWLGASSASTLAFAGFYLYGFARMSSGSLSRIPQQVITVRDTMEVPLPAVLERMAGGKERINAQLKAQRQLTRGVLDSPAFIWWSIAAGTTMMCAILGSLVGSLAWGGAMLGGRIFLGQWPLEATESGVTGEHHY